MPIPTIDPRAIALSVLGRTISGFAKGTFITPSFEADAFSDEVGATGDVVRILNCDRRGTLKFSLMRSSLSNDYLSSIAVADRLTTLLTGPSFVKDGKGTSLASSDVSWVKKIPDAPYATESTNVDWEIRCANLDLYVGGVIPL